MKILLRTLGLLFLLALAGGGWVAYEAHTFLNTAPETPGREVFYDVPTGARLAQVSAGLVKLGVVTDARKLDLLARYKKWENRLQAGRFALNTGWLPEKVLDELVNGHPVLYRVTVPEGLSWWQTGKAAFLATTRWRLVPLRTNWPRAACGAICQTRFR